MSEEKPIENGTDEEEVDNWDKWRRAGIVAKEALALARPMIEPGTKKGDILLDSMLNVCQYGLTNLKISKVNVW